MRCDLHLKTDMRWSGRLHTDLSCAEFVEGPRFPLGADPSRQYLAGVLSDLLKTILAGRKKQFVSRSEYLATSSGVAFTYWFRRICRSIDSMTASCCSAGNFKI